MQGTKKGCQDTKELLTFSDNEICQYTNDNKPGTRGLLPRIPQKMSYCILTKYFMYRHC